MRNCIFVLSIDTEEEWDWKGPFPNQDVSVENVQKIPAFHELITELGVRPTYFLDYAVIENLQSRQCLQELAVQYDNFEFGSHLHPWVTPPKTRINEEADSHIVNLPIAIVSEQIAQLTTAIEQEFSVKPVAFRSGRWGINEAILCELAKQGYQVDSSIYPYYKNEWFSCEDESSIPTRLSLKPEGQSITEIPVTAGFNTRNYHQANRLHNILERAPLRYLRPIGLLWKLNLLKKIYLSPELSNAEDMIQLCKSALANNAPVIHMYLHSSSLLPDQTGYVKNTAAKKQFIDNIRKTIKFLTSQCNVQMCTISEAAERLSQEGNL